MLKTIFYVSRKTTPWPHDQADVDAITDVAISRNGDLKVTGALISTDRHFAQVLEGPPEGVDIIMASILADPRHHEIRVLKDSPIERRLFATWSLAYAGRATYVSGQVDPLVSGRGADYDARRLFDCILAFSRAD